MRIQISLLLLTISLLSILCVATALAETTPVDPVDTAAPTTPTTLSASTINGTGFKLSWKASTDNVAITSYNVYLNGEYRVTVSTTTYTFTGLNQQTTYTATVVALDAAKNRSSFSEPLSVLTKAAPTDLSISSNVIAENMPGRSEVGSFSATDPDVNDTFSYRLMSCPGSIDNNLFHISGKILKTNRKLNFEKKSTYTICVRVTDGAGLFFEKLMTVQVTNENDLPQLTGPGELKLHELVNGAITGIKVSDEDSAELTFQAKTQNGALTVSQTAGVTNSGNGSADLMLIGSATALNQALATLRYTTSNPITGNTPIQLQVSDGGPFQPYRIVQNGIYYSTQTGRYYEYVAAPSITWTDARAKAKLRTAFGLNGYLTNITSQEEQDFVVELLGGKCTWLGLSDEVVEGEFRWVDGPEAGQLPNYKNWNVGEPNNVMRADAPGGEDYAQFLGDNIGLWNDERNLPPYSGGAYGSTGYVVEYGDAVSDAAGARTLVIQSDVTPPSTPFRLSANYLTHESLQLLWSASTDNVGVTQYAVFSNGVKLGTTVATSFNIGGLSAKTPYKLAVQALDAAGNASLMSAELQVTTLDMPDTQAPTAPTGLSASNITTSGFRVSWSPATDNVGVTGYNVYRNAAYVATVGATSYTFTGLTSDSSHQITVMSLDGAKNRSPLSTALSVRTLVPLDTTSPSTPMSLIASEITATGLRLSWLSSTDNIGVLYYDVMQAGIKIASTTSNSLLITGMRPVNTYAFTVQAVDASANRSALSAVLSASTTADTIAPTAPTALYASLATTSGFRVTWSAATDNVAVANYNVYRNGAYIATIGGTSYTFSGLAANSSHTITVLALDGAKNRSPLSAPITVKTLATADTLAPTVPGSLAISSVTASSVSLTWALSTDQVQLSRYEVYRNGVKVADSAELSATISGLTPLSSYSITVLAVDTAGNRSPHSIAVTANTIADTEVPLAPLLVSTSNVTSTGLTLSWQAAKDNVAVTAYNVYRNGNYVTTVSTTSTSITGLSAGTSYTFTVLALDAAKNKSALSVLVAVRTP